MNCRLVGQWALFVMLLSSSVLAYPWMNRHGYNNCVPCHVDPSGGSMLTDYGRAQSVLLLSSAYGNSDEDPEPEMRTLFGLVPELPTWQLGGWIRSAYLWNSVNHEKVDERFVQMQADVAAFAKSGSMQAYATVGYGTPDGAPFQQQATLLSASNGAALLSREHWIGFSNEDEQMLVRLGRINLPFGVRSIEHSSWIRSETRTDINQNQQHGIAWSMNTETFRTEWMAIAGNFQVAPDSYRERGYSGYFEWHFRPEYSVGLNSLLTFAETDIVLHGKLLRTANGLFARVSPMRRISVIAEIDALLNKSQQPNQLPETETKWVGWLQLDTEPWRGVHATSSLELLENATTNQSQIGGWLSLSWFVYSHLDVRFDAIHRVYEHSFPTGTYLFQLHAYL